MNRTGNVTTKTLGGLLAATFLTSVAAPATPPSPITRGQTPAEVRSRLGPPQRISRQILLGRHVEQWVYEDQRPGRVDFSCIRGEDPYVCAILQLSPGQP
jgi:hypothetical protein